MSKKLNIDALKQKLESLSKTNESKFSGIWKPKEGKNLIRIVPLEKTPDNPFIILQFYYLNGKTQLSPATYGEPDPIMEFGQKIKEESGFMDKDRWNIIKKLFPQPRYFAPIVTYDEENNLIPELKYWGFSTTVANQLIGIIEDDDYGNITDIETGRGLLVTFTPKEKSDTKFAKTTIMPRGNSTKLSTDKEVLKKLLTNQLDIFDIYPKMTHDELMDAANKYLESGRDSSDEPTDDTVSTKESSDEAFANDEPTKPESKKKTKSSVAKGEDAFSKIFNEEE